MNRPMRALARARAWTLVSSKLYARLDGKFSGATASAGGTVRYFRNGYIAEDCADFQWIRGWDILMKGKLMGGGRTQSGNNLFGNKVIV